MSSLAMRLSDLRQRPDQRPSRNMASGTSSAGVPASIMLPRILFLVTAAALVLFGLLMIYSASSIMGLTSKLYDYNPMYFLTRQSIFAVAGVVAAAGLAFFDYHQWRGNVLYVCLFILIASLAVVYSSLAGQDAFGASRWIAIGPFTLQPSEFAKIFVLLAGARLWTEYYEGQDVLQREYWPLILGGILIPLVLIFFQPDKGTTGILAVALLVMAALAGMPKKYLLIFVAVVGLVALLYALRDDYSRARIFTMFDPSGDEYGAGYQLTQGFYALGSGGVTGVGLGLSRQKYNYLPMAHNDFIFAIIGEELGFVGCVCVLLAFGVLLWAGLKIAEQAPDMFGRLIAAGCTSLLIVQLMLNVCGVLGIFPLSGKPVPFISYGGSSIISSLALVGLVLSVSLRSKLPETSHDRRRAALRLAEDDFESHVDIDGSRAGEARPRSARLAGTSRPPMRVIEGGAPPTSPPTRSSRRARR